MPIAAYVRPRTIEEAVEALAEGPDPAFPLAGGTDLLVQSKVGTEVGTVVDLKHIDEVVRVDRVDGHWVIGAGVPAYRLAANTQLRDELPGVAEGAELIGSTQIQGRATLGGNVCNASPAADAVPALLVNDAIAVVAGPGGRRDLPVVELLTGPGTTALERGEFVVAFRISRPAPGQGDAAVRFIPRTEMDIAVANAAVRLRLEGERCADAAVAIGAVGPRAVRVPEAEEALAGQEPSDDGVLAAVADACRGAADPIADRRGTVEYRTHAIGVLATRATRTAHARARMRDT